MFACMENGLVFYPLADFPHGATRRYYLDFLLLKWLTFDIFLNRKVGIGKDLRFVLVPLCFNVLYPTLDDIIGPAGNIVSVTTLANKGPCAA